MEVSHEIKKKEKKKMAQKISSIGSTGMQETKDMCKTFASCYTKSSQAAHDLYENVL